MCFLAESANMTAALTSQYTILNRRLSLLDATLYYISSPVPGEANQVQEGKYLSDGSCLSGLISVCTVN